jgi:hypothetical protein
MDSVGRGVRALRNYTTSATIIFVCGLQWDGTVEVARHFFLERSRMMQILFSVCVEWLA